MVENASGKAALSMLPCDCDCVGHNSVELSSITALRRDGEMRLSWHEPVRILGNRCKAL